MQRASPGRMLPSPQSASKRANADLCSIFVGNLPPDATDAQLREIFSMFGPITHVEIVRKPSVHGTSILLLVRTPGRLFLGSRYQCFRIHTVPQSRYGGRCRPSQP